MSTKRRLAVVSFVAVGATYACGGEIAKDASALGGMSGATRNSEFASGGMPAVSWSAGLGGGVANGGTSLTGGTAGAASGCTAVLATGSPGLIDDLNDGDGIIPMNDGRNGGWYLVNDGTGNQTSSVASATGCDPTYSFSPTNDQACTSGDGFQVWGAAMGIEILGGPDCKSCNYDATAYHGVSFTISGTVQGALRFMVITADTHGTQWGGTCTTESVCADSYGVPLQVTPDQRVVQVAWSDLAQAGWGTPMSLNLHQVQTLQWSVEINSTSASFQNLCVDNVAFY